MSIYDLLRRDYRLHSAGINNSEARGNESYPDPFDPARKPEWITDLREELVDGMVYARAQLVLLEPLTRTSAKARHAALTIRDVERRLSRCIADLADLDGDWADPAATKEYPPHGV